MKKANGLSIVIPTFQREKQLIRILDSLRNQLTKDITLEVNICDSYSNYDVINFNKYNDSFQIKYHNIEKNNLSAKRNFGILNSLNKKIILIDDDCIPENNFIKSYLKDFSLIDHKTILSGIVSYPKNYVRQNNHITFKQSRHFNHKNIYKDKEIAPDKIVAMNMGIILSKEFKNLGLFNENFDGYGFEDYEFAYRYNLNNFKLIKTKATILHDEGKPNIKKYIIKHYHLGRDGMKNLIKVNNKAAKLTNYYKIENNIFINLLIKVPKIKYLILLLEKIISNLDKFKFMYLPFIFNLLRVCSYTRGYMDRNIRNLNKNNWYE